MKLKIILPLLLVWFASSSTLLLAQNQVKARMSLNFIKDGNDGPTIKAYVKYKENRTYFPGADIKLSLLRANGQQSENDPKTEVSFTKVEEVVTNQDGVAFFYLNPDQIGSGDQLYQVVLKNNPKFKDVTEEISFQDATIKASIVENEDSSRSINVKLVDAEGNPVAGQYFTIRLERLFGQMEVGGESYYKTDEKGEIVADIQQEFFSKSGKLNFIVKLDDSRNYGTIIEKVTANFGTKMESKDTFDERTMWSTAIKAPLFVLIIPNILLLSVWGALIMLVYNLYRILNLNKKHKTI